MTPERTADVTAARRRLARGCGKGLLGALMVLLLPLERADVERRARAPHVAPTHAATDGDPIDLATGLYIRRTVDLVLMDGTPLILTRTYRNRDSQSRPFGIGTNHSAVAS